MPHRRPHRRRRRRWSRRCCWSRRRRGRWSRRRPRWRRPSGPRDRPTRRPFRSSRRLRRRRPAPQTTAIRNRCRLRSAPTSSAPAKSRWPQGNRQPNGRLLSVPKDFHRTLCIPARKRPRRRTVGCRPCKSLIRDRSSWNSMWTSSGRLAGRRGCLRDHRRRCDVAGNAPRPWRRVVIDNGRRRRQARFGNGAAEQGRRPLRFLGGGEEPGGSGQAWAARQRSSTNPRGTGRDAAAGVAAATAS